MNTDSKAAADQQPKLNTLIPMADAAGNRCFVNSWDVASRKTDGWKVLGDLAYHQASTNAPTALLNGKGTPAPKEPPNGSASADGGVAAERARIRVILKAADDEQGELADKLIAEGTPEAEAVQALVADREARKPKRPASTPKPAAAAAPAAAPADATPPKQ